MRLHGTSYTRENQRISRLQDFKRLNETSRGFMRLQETSRDFKGLPRLHETFQTSLDFTAEVSLFPPWFIHI
jgi:hypothetical protein